MEHIPALNKMVSNPQVSQKEINSFVNDVCALLLLFTATSYICVLSLTMGPKMHDPMTFKGSELWSPNGSTLITAQNVLCDQETVMVEDLRILPLVDYYAGLRMTGPTQSEYVLSPTLFFSPHWKQDPTRYH